MITAEEARKIVDLINPEIEKHLKIIETAIIDIGMTLEISYLRALKRGGSL